jgi:hypothetical protein
MLSVTAVDFRHTGMTKPLKIIGLFLSYRYDIINSSFLLIYAMHLE